MFWRFTSILLAFEKELKDNPADLVLVVGDVTSTMACALVAKNLIPKLPMSKAEYVLVI